MYIDLYFIYEHVIPITNRNMRHPQLRSLDPEAQESGLEIDKS